MGSTTQIESFTGATLGNRANLTRSLPANPTLRGFEYFVFAGFAVLLAAVTLRHAMWRDELQAWLIARDSHSLLQLFHCLRYEGHPALWYLLLYPVAHLTWNPAAMQAINYAVALATAWLIVMAGEIPRGQRLLLVFSFFIFYQYGVIARSYELATLLLVASARAHRQRPRLAALLLALAINTHFFAVPLAALMAVWLFCFANGSAPQADPQNGSGLRADAQRKQNCLHDRDLRFAAAILFIALLACYCTLRPAQDIAPLPYAPTSFSGALLHVGSTAWQMFVPYVPSPVHRHFDWLFRPSPALCALSMVLFVAAAFALRSWRARWFFLACAAAELLTMAFTIRNPDVYHFGLIFASFIVALYLDAMRAPAKSSYPTRLRRTASGLLLAILGVQSLCVVAISALEWHRAYSASQETAEWLKQNRLADHPLVLDPAEFTFGILAYLQRPTAYYSSCHCFASYQLRSLDRSLPQTITASDLAIARGGSLLPVVLVSNARLDEARRQSLGLEEIHATAEKPFQFDEDFVIYLQRRP